MNVQTQIARSRLPAAYGTPQLKPAGQVPGVSFGVPVTPGYGPPTYDPTTGLPLGLTGTGGTAGFNYNASAPGYTTPGYVAPGTPGYGYTTTPGYGTTGYVAPGTVPYNPQLQLQQQQNQNNMLMIAGVAVVGVIAAVVLLKPSGAKENPTRSHRRARRTRRTRRHSRR